MPPRDESLLAVHGCKQVLIKELTDRLKRVGRWSDSQPSSGTSTPSYNSPNDSNNDSPQYVLGYDTNVPLRTRGPSDLRHHHTDDASLLWPSILSCDVSYPPTTDLYYRHSSDRVRSLQDDALIDRFDHSAGNWRQECAQDNKQFRTPDRSYHSLRCSENYHPMYPPPMQYGGPTPTIPDFSHDDPREFARLKLALDNILHESFKFQILLDHLKLEDALLVADSYSHSRTPFSDTMRALTDMYGQPHQLALQRITNLMDGPNIRSGDVKSFKGFAFRV